MKNFLSKQTIWSYLLLAATILLIPGFIIFMVNSTTGYLKGSDLSPVVVSLSIIALLLGLFLALFGEKLGKFSGICYLLFAAMVAVSIAGIAWSVESIVADLFFIPVNHPESEDASWALAVTSLVFYSLSFLSATVSCFGGTLYKKAESK